MTSVRLSTLAVFLNHRTNTTFVFLQVLGVVHVLTGPDHLSALATLSANAETGSAFLLGVRWGIGHSTGLLSIGVIFILISRASENPTIDIPDAVSHFFESLVGAFMILLGMYGCRRAWEKRPTYLTIPSDNSSIRQAVDCESFGEVEIDTIDPSYHNHMITEHVPSNLPQQEEEQIEHAHLEGWLGRLASGISTRSMALFAGIIHGLAGPGGVLGVIPAVQLHNARLAAVYLSSFCASSTLTMGCFAVLYGSCSRRLGQGVQNSFMIELLSASLSILVGVTWLFLLSIGKLEDVFP